jgi:hypothetical protein
MRETLLELVVDQITEYGVAPPETSENRPIVKFVTVCVSPTPSQKKLWRRPSQFSSTTILLQERLTKPQSWLPNTKKRALMPLKK